MKRKYEGMCSLCNKAITRDEWDSFGGMCCRCENKSYIGNYITKGESK